ncbi:hypothetical protein KCU85_g277, partial [Aureobasidium melanogenum]
MPLEARFESMVLPKESFGIEGGVVEARSPLRGHCRGSRRSSRFIRGLCINSSSKKIVDQTINGRGTDISAAIDKRVASRYLALQKTSCEFVVQITKLYSTQAGIGSVAVGLANDFVASILSIFFSGSIWICRALLRLGMEGAAIWGLSPDDDVPELRLPLEMHRRR